ncbi:MAG: tetratricopeptide repeat protein [Candidatus Melainabacteria bacterium]|nr:tetratricopeptide repeat protein [Candidatus Melainabacteria bacterium]
MSLIHNFWNSSKNSRHHRVGLAIACLVFFSQNPAFSSAYFDLQTHWTKVFNDGVTALDSNLYGKAEPLLKEAVELSERFGAGDPRGPKSLGELGRLYTIRRRYSEAEPLLEQQLHLTEVQLGKNSGKTVPALGSMIKFYLMYGTPSKADPLAEELLGFLDGKMREDAEANAERAKAQTGKVLTAWAGTAPPGEHIPRIEWAVTCDRLGDVYRLKKKYAMAERFYKAGLDIKVTVIGKEHMSMAISYDNLGILEMDKEEYADAAEYFRQSLETTQKIMGMGDPDTYARLDRLARALIKSKRYDEAEKTYNLALKLWHDEPNTGGATARCLYQLGSMYAEQGRMGQAASFLGRALNLSIRASGPLSYTNVAYLRRYAYVLYYCGRRGESDNLKARANWLAAGMDEPVAAKPAEKTAAEKAAEKTAQADKAKNVGIAKSPADKTDKSAQGEKTAKGDKSEKGNKTAKNDKSGKGDKTATTAKTEPPSLTEQAMKIWDAEMAAHAAQEAKEAAEKAAKAAEEAAKPAANAAENVAAPATGIVPVTGTEIVPVTGAETTPAQGTTPVMVEKAASGEMSTAAEKLEKVEKTEPPVSPEQQGNTDLPKATESAPLPGKSANAVEKAEEIR